MNSRRRIIVLSVLIILIAIVSGVSVAYAYWAKTIISENPNIVRSGCLNIEFSDLSSPISVDRTYPGENVYIDDILDIHSNSDYVEDSNYIFIDRHNDYYFKVTNTCNSPINYQVNLETLSNSDLDNHNLYVRLVEYVINNADISNYADLKNFFDNSSDEIFDYVSGYRSNNLDSFESVNTSLDNAIFSNRLHESSLNPYQAHIYSLNVSLDDGTDDSMNKTWNGKVTITSSYNPDTVPSGDSILEEYAFSDTFGRQGVKAIKPFKDIPDAEIISNATIISKPGTQYTYAWLDDDTLYYYSEANKIYMLSEMFGAPGSDWAAYFADVEYLDLSGLDTSKMTDMSYMFYKLAKLEYLDISSFDTSNVTNMNGMFDHCIKLKTLDLSNFNTSSVTEMSGLFSEMFALEDLNISSFDTKNVIDMSGMFEKCGDLKSLDLSFFNTSNVTNMSGMFSCCYDLMSLNLSNFDTRNVVYMSNMFGSCYSLTELDLSSFETGNVNFRDSYCFGCGLFNSTSNLTSITIDCEKSPSLKDYIQSKTSKTIVCSNEG